MIERLNQNDQSKLRIIKFYFDSMQTQFNIYNNLNYKTEDRFKAFDIAETFIKKLAEEFSLYYVIHDEDNEHSFIRPDCYREEYDDKYQRRIEIALNLKYDTGEE